MSAPVAVRPVPLTALATRLLAGAVALGVRLVDGPAPAGTPVTFVVGESDAVLDLMHLVRTHGAAHSRVLVLSRLGAHPDASVPSLQALWRLEEEARATGAPTLTLRTAPVVGEGAPLWAMLRTRPALPGGGRRLVDPVHERDAIATLAHALTTATWPAGEGWYELAGPERFAWSELAELAVRGPAPQAVPAWEPSLEEIGAHRLAESEPWLTDFAIAPTRLSTWASAGVA